MVARLQTNTVEWEVVTAMAVREMGCVIPTAARRTMVLTDNVILTAALPGAPATHTVVPK